MENKGLLIVSFGTSHEDALENAIAAVEREAAAAFPDRVALRAFTSGMIRRKLAKEGKDIFDVPGALKELKARGVEDLLVLPTHLIGGDEYEKLLAFLAEGEPFASLRVAKPLMSSLADVDAVLSVVSAAVAREEGEALVLMGHGTEHDCNLLYAAADRYAKDKVARDLFVGTVEAWPDLEATVAAVKAAGYTRALLTPLMLVAGDHAKNDMAGEWADRFRAEGIEPRCLIRGLGEYPGIRALYVQRAKAAEDSF